MEWITREIEVPEGAAEVHNIVMLELMQAGKTMEEALLYLYPEPCDPGTWLCNRREDA